MIPFLITFHHFSRIFPSLFFRFTFFNSHVSNTAISFNKCEKTAFCCNALRRRRKQWWRESESLWLVKTRWKWDCIQRAVQKRSKVFFNFSFSSSSSFSSLLFSSLLFLSSSPLFVPLSSSPPPHLLLLISTPSKECHSRVYAERTLDEFDVAETKWWRERRKEKEICYNESSFSLVFCLLMIKWKKIERRQVKAMQNFSWKMEMNKEN